MDFKDKKSTRKGIIAENWIKNEFLPANGWIVWWNSNNYSTTFDGFAQKKEKRIICEVKQKTLTKYNSYSIHKNDLQAYLKSEKDENRQMTIFYLNNETKKLYAVTPNKIKDNVKIESPDWEDGKSLLYFDEKICKIIGSVPDSVCEEINNIDKEDAYE